MSRDAILHRVRTALGRTAGQPPAEPPPVYLRKTQWTAEQRIEYFTSALESLAGRVYRVPSRAGIPSVVESILDGRTAVRSSAPILDGLGALPGVSGPLGTPEEIRAASASVGVGITSADYGLAETGTLVMLASSGESRLISLLPPAWISVVPASILLDDLDELLARVPTPADLTGAMVLITGPSRTADIEQILIRGVHGPGEVHVVLVDSETA
jgi:L-lactate dehydrogenase complex protein LldG